MSAADPTPTSNVVSTGTSTVPPIEAAALTGARILITGGAGFVGSTITDLALAAGVDSVVLVDNLVRGRYENLDAAMSTGRVELVVGDIRDHAVLARTMRGVDVVFHQAALRITQCADDPRAAVDVMATGTLNVLEAARTAGVRRVVAASSASVYGMATEFPTPEHHHAYDNRTLYGAAKLFDEGLLRSYHDMYGLDYVALRYFNVYGPRMDIHGVYTEVLVRWMERIVRGEPLLIFGDGSQTMDFVFIDDVGRANLLAATSTATDRVYNVARGEETSLLQLAEALQRVMHSDVPIEFGPERSINPVPRRLADTRAAERDLGFRATVGLDGGLAALVDWWRTERARAAAA
jgi:UDP-glucose 4-epimerase